MPYVLDKDCPVGWEKHNPLAGGKCWHYCQVIPDKEKELTEKVKEQKKKLEVVYKENNELKNKLTQSLEKNKKKAESKDDLKKQLKRLEKENSDLTAEVGRLSVETDNKDEKLAKKDEELYIIKKELEKLKTEIPNTFEKWVEKQSKIIPLNKKWELIHSDFNGSVGKQKQNKWESKGFSYEDVSFLIKIAGLKADEYDLAEWIRDDKKIILTDLPNENLLELKEKFIIAKSQNKVIFTLHSKMDNTDITRRFGYLLFQAPKLNKWISKGEAEHTWDEGKRITLKLNEKNSLMKIDDVKYLLLNNAGKKIMVSSLGILEWSITGKYSTDNQLTINEPFSISIYENND